MAREASFPGQGPDRRGSRQETVPIIFVDDEGRMDGEVSESYPFNPNGSPFGIAGTLYKGRTTSGDHAASGASVFKVAVALDACFAEQ